MIAVRLDDLAFVRADAIARPVNAELRAITPVMRRLELAAGDSLAMQLRVNEPLEIGAAVVTGAGELEAELLIHAVVASDREAVSPAGVRRATASAMQRAADWGIAHLALAPFGLGAGNLDAEQSADVMVDTIVRQRGSSRHPVTLTIVVETALEERAFRAAITHHLKGR